MVDLSARVSPDVEGETVATVQNALSFGDRSRRLEHLCQQSTVLFGHLAGIGDVLTGDYQDMDRGHGPQVVEGIGEFARVSRPRGQFPGNYSAENAVWMPSAIQ
jgi:hypothetical protein